MGKNKINDLTNGDIKKILIGLAIPIIGASFLQMTYGLVDMLWIGRLGSNSVAAIGTASFFINLGYAINSMVVTGAGIKISHTIGEKNLEKTSSLIKAGITINRGIGILFIGTILLFSSQLVAFFNLNAEVESLARIYLLIAGFGLTFKFKNFLYTRILNSFGESKLPFKISFVGVLINIVLDPILIFGFNLGVGGAALATIIAEGTMSLLFSIHSKKYFIIDGYFSKEYSEMKEMMKLGFPIALQRVLFTGFGIAVAKIISTWGADAIAAQKIGLQLESISFMTIGGLQGAVSSFVGQNYGARLKERIKDGYTIAIKLALLVGTISTILFLVFPENLAKLFVSKKDTVDITVNYLKIIGLSQIFMCFEIVTNGSFSGIGKPKIPSTISIIFTSLRIPIAFILSKEEYFGLNGVWIAISGTSIIKGIISPMIFRKSLKKI